MTEKVVKSIRMNPAVYERLSTVAKEGGLDAGSALESLLNAWDIQSAKGQVPERAADVADFDAAIQSAQKAFLRSLDLAQSAENRARAAYQAQLDAAAATISRLQADLEEERKRNKTLSEIANAATEGRKRMEARIMELEKSRKLESLLETLANRLDAPILPESKPKAATRRKATPKATEAAPMGDENPEKN